MRLNGRVRRYLLIPYVIYRLLNLNVLKRQW
nr:MAG TPA: hypothetical protein [Caudoviricetes sp.]